MSPEKGTPYKEGSIVRGIKSAVGFFREFPSVYVQSFREALAEMRDRREFINQARQARLKFHENLRRADTENTSLAVLSAARNELDDLFIRRMSTKPRGVQQALLEVVEADAKRYEGRYRNTGDDVERLKLEVSTRIANRLRHLIGNDPNRVDEQSGIT